MATVYKASDGSPVEVPDDKVHEALADPQYTLPKGSLVPISVNGQPGTIPIEHLDNAIAGGASLIPHSELRQAELQEKYKGAGNALLAAGTSALDTATLGISNAIIGGLSDEEQKKHLREVQEAHPTAATAGSIAGIAAPIVADVFTGGALTPEIAAVAGAKAGEKGLLREGAELAGKGLMAPTRAVDAVGSAVGDGIRGLIGQDATSFAGKLAQKAIPNVAEEAVKGGFYGAGGQLGEESLKDHPDLTGEKMLHAIGYGALLGGTAGAAFGTASAIGSKIMDSAAPKLEQLSNKYMIKALDSTGNLAKELEELPGGVDAFRKRLSSEGVVKVGDDISTIAPKALDARIKAETELNAEYTKLDGALKENPAKGVPLYRLLDAVDEAIPKTKLGSLEAGGIDAAALKKDLAGLVQKEDFLSTFAGYAQKKAAGLKVPEEVISGTHLNFTEAAKISDALLDRMKQGGSSKMMDQLRDLNKKVSGITEESAVKLNSELAEKGKQIFEWKPGESLLNQPRVVNKIMKAGETAEQGAEISANTVLLSKINKVKQLRLADEFASKEAEKFASHSGGSHVLSTRHLSHFLLGHAVGHGALGIAVPFVRQIMKEKGAVAASTVLDKLSVLGRLQKSIEHMDSELDTKIEALYSHKVPKGFRGTNAKSVEAEFTENMKQLSKATGDVENHLGLIEAHTKFISGAAPQVAAAFQKAAIRTTIYLTQELPKDPNPPDPLFGQHNSYQPSDQEMSGWNRKFKVATDPLSIMDRVNDGSVTPQEVAALQATNPALYQQMSQQITDGAKKSKKKPSIAKQTGMKTFLSQPLVMPTTYNVIRKTWVSAPQMPKSMGGIGHAAHFPAGGGPASQVGLTPRHGRH